MKKEKIAVNILDEIVYLHLHPVFIHIVSPYKVNKIEKTGI